MKRVLSVRPVDYLPQIELIKFIPARGKKGGAGEVAKKEGDLITPVGEGGEESSNSRFNALEAGY